MQVKDLGMFTGTVEDPPMKQTNCAKLFGVGDWLETERWTRGCTCHIPLEIKLADTVVGQLRWALSLELETRSLERNKAK